MSPGPLVPPGNLGERVRRALPTQDAQRLCLSVSSGQELGSRGNRRMGLELRANHFYSEPHLTPQRRVVVVLAIALL